MKTTDPTEIRLRLLENGYSPIPNENKETRLKNWPRVQITPDLIEGRWRRKVEDWPATGVRLDGPLLAMDFDIDSAEVLESLWSSLSDGTRAILERAPVRYGSGAKEALFLRYSGGAGYRMAQSKVFRHPESGKGMKLEVFGSGVTRQFGAFGPHSHSDDGEVLLCYTWADKSLLDIRLEDLPEITEMQVMEVLDAASTAMHDAGWEYELSPPSSTEKHVYDLPEDGVFRVAGGYGLEEGSELSLAQLEELCEVVDPAEVRLSASWLFGDTSDNLKRCWARIDSLSGRVKVWETSAQSWHHLPDTREARSPATWCKASIARLGEALASGARERLLKNAKAESRSFQETEKSEGGQAEDSEVLEAARNEIVEALVERYAYWSDGSGYVVDVERGPEAAMSISSFRTKMRPLAWEEVGPRGGVKEINPAEEWEKHPQRGDVAGYRFLPRSRERAVADGDLVFLNTWERPEWWDKDVEVSGEGAVTFFQFLEHLIPSDDERKWFIGWLAAKAQKPWLPNCGVVMVAERQGTGRGTLFDMLGCVLGRRHVKNVSAVQLIGGGSQSQYTDWLEESLVVTCDEVLAGDDTGGAMAWKRREVYERLKAMVDPRPRVVPIVRKGLPNYQTEVYASFLLATNNVNALPLSPDDRRIAVITNTGVPLVEHGDFLDRLNVWRSDEGFTDEFCASVFAALRQVNVDWSSVRESPRWMLGRARMLEANETDLDGVLENILEGLEGDFILGHHLRERVGRSLEANGLIGDVKHWWSKTQDVLSRMNRLGWRRMDGRHKYAPKDMTSNVSVVFYREKGAGPDAWLAASRDERVKLWAGGDPAARKAASDLGRRMAEKGIKVIDKE